MKKSIRLKLNQKPGFRLVIASVFVISIVFAIISVTLQIGSVTKTQAASGDKTFISGTYIVNLGISPQTKANGLKPYGMVYDLLHNYDVPVDWAIKASKSKDGTDFTYNSVNYKGGSFIISKLFITPAVQARIAYWESQGVVGTYINSPLTVNVYTTLTTFPLVMIDSLASNQDIIETYYSNASIPSNAYSIGTPAGLTQCYDVWTNPHGDPTWATHYYLYDFVTVQKSWIWAECHSVSMMEYCKSGSQQLNFLSSKGLQCYGSNKCTTNPETHAKASSSPYTYFFPTDPVMQFLGDAHGASSGGSERWYIPISTGQWNSNTRVGISTGDATSPKSGTVLVYGPAFNDPTNGWVMYQGGHDLDGNGSSTEKIAAQRAYFNFVLLAGKSKRINVTASLPSTMNVGETATASSVADSGTPPYTYQWTSSLGGSFLNSTDSTTIYTAPSVMSDTMDVVKIKVTDQCGRVNFYYQYVNIGSSPLPVELLSFIGSKKNEYVELSWSTVSEINNDYFSIERSANGEIWSLIGTVKGNGNSTLKSDYSLLDKQPLHEVAYYRLSQTDYDGTKKSYRIIRINSSKGFVKGTNPLNISPNPFNNAFSFEINSELNERIELNLFSTEGDLVIQKSYSVKRGSNRLVFSDSGLLNAGVYFMALKTQSGKIISSKVVKI